ncbi:hypothetical protein FOMPIDRAFT_1024703 [Fomitopsis schrenkii]|uniref:Uncharacterized protein n=1 Tax=Fomitopsis schrenkii TaxID=2126942 RepID=S8DZ62_FOMSC|nr:hypothetical protein FOMPIDRAFT_1024703 [Fomitopsis schrenkii]
MSAVRNDSAPIGRVCRSHTPYGWDVAVLYVSITPSIPDSVVGIPFTRGVIRAG